MTTVITRLRVLTLLALGGLPAAAHAQSCWVSGAATLDFGSVSAAAATDAQTTVAVNCQGSFNAPGGTATRFRVCLFVGEGDPSGMAPRRMTNYNGAYLNYDLYSNAARTLLVGPLGSTYPVYSLPIAVSQGVTTLTNMPLYGRVPAGQSAPATSSFQGHPANSVMRYSYGYQATPSEADCRNGVPGPGGGIGESPIGWTAVTATYANTCRVTVATDLDFGNANALTGNRDQTSTIQLRCPKGTAWRVGLDNGINANGTQRRMASGSNRLNYELYSNTARSRRWGNDNSSDVTGTGSDASQSLTVYGRVPAQPGAAGRYEDTITVTLTY